VFSCFKISSSKDQKILCSQDTILFLVETYCRRARCYICTLIWRWQRVFLWRVMAPKFVARRDQPSLAVWCRTGHHNVMHDLHDVISMQNMIFLADFREKWTFFDLERYHSVKVNSLLLKINKPWHRQHCFLVFPSLISLNFVVGPKNLSQNRSQ